MPGLHNFGMPQGIPMQQGIYGTTDKIGYPQKQTASTYLSGVAGGRRRINVFAICLSVFMPWAIFIGMLALLSFHAHYMMPYTVRSIEIVGGAILGLVVVVSFVSMTKKRFGGEDSLTGGSSWMLFMSATSLLSLFLAVAIGNRNYVINTQPFYDLDGMNSYTKVDPSATHGQELMDAGRVEFVKGTHLLLNKSMGFKNQDTFCVAPIAGEGNAPLASYDFWAVGRNCCQDGGANFKCGAFNNTDARSGVRLVADGDRAFYRLAIQQAQSAYNIKAVHPLFFHWTDDADKSMHSYRQQGYKYYLLAMFAHFGFQMGLVYVAATCFKIWGTTI